MRVILALQRAPHSAAALRPAVDLARGLGAPLAALFVEDPAVLASADLPVTSELDLASAQPQPLSTTRLEQALRREARQAEQAMAEALRREAVAFTFHVVRTRLEAAIRAEAGAGDLVLLGLFARGSSWTGPAAGPLAGAPVAAYCSAGLIPARVLQMAARLCQASGRPLVLAAPRGEGEQVRRLACARDVPAGPAWLPEAGIPEFVRMAAQRGASVCVMAAGHAADARLALHIRAGIGSTILALVR